jgi:hypothetical protein
MVASYCCTGEVHTDLLPPRLPSTGTPGLRDVGDDSKRDLNSSIKSVKVWFILTCSLVCQEPLACEMLGKIMVGDLKCSIIGLKMRFILTCSLVCQEPLARCWER